MDLLEVLPLAFVVIAGPQIVTAFLLATTTRWVSNSAAYVGAAVSVMLVVTIGYLIARASKSAAGHTHAATADKVIDGVVLALMLFLIVHVYLNRKTDQAAQCLVARVAHSCRPPTRRAPASTPRLHRQAAEAATCRCRARARPSAATAAGEVSPAPAVKAALELRPVQGRRGMRGWFS